MAEGGCYAKIVFLVLIYKYGQSCLQLALVIGQMAVQGLLTSSLLEEQVRRSLPSPKQNGDTHVIASYFNYVLNSMQKSIRDIGKCVLVRIFSKQHHAGENDTNAVYLEMY